MRPARSVLLLAAFVAACASPPGGPAGRSVGASPARVPELRPAEIRQPALLIRLSLGPGEWTDRQRTSLPAEYEGTILEGLNAKAVLAKDVRLVTVKDGAFDARAALERARAIGADHAILIEVRVSHEIATFCEGTARPLRGPATVWRQEVEVFRASDGAARLTRARAPELVVTDVDPDCENPRKSERRSPEDTLALAVEKLLTRLFGP